MLGQSYNYQLFATGTAPIVWQKLSGTLPTGLSFSSSGVLSGTPMSAGTASFTVEASNFLGTDTKTFNLSVSKPIIRTFIGGREVNSFHLEGNEVDDLFIKSIYVYNRKDGYKGESIVLIINSSDGTFTIPTRAYGASSQNVAYNWTIDGSLNGIDYVFIQNSSGTGSASGGVNVTIPSGLQNTNMYLRIRDYTNNDNYAWCKAFGFGEPVATVLDLQSNRDKVQSIDISGCQKGFRLDGTSTLGIRFFSGIACDCRYLTSFKFMDVSKWNISGALGGQFMTNAFRNTASLRNIIMLNSGNWNITEWTGNFMQYAFMSSGLYTIDLSGMTTNWNPTNIMASTCVQSFDGCIYMTSMKMFDLSNFSSVLSFPGTNFFLNTLTNVFSYSKNGVLYLKDYISNPLYTGGFRALTTNSMGLADVNVATVYVPSALVTAFQNSAS